MTAVMMPLSGSTKNWPFLVLTMTALQMATASLAVQKSVMKTMVGLRDAAAADSFGAVALEQPAKMPASRKVQSSGVRVRNQRDISDPFVWISSINFRR